MVCFIISCNSNFSPIYISAFFHDEKVERFNGYRSRKKYINLCRTCLRLESVECQLTLMIAVVSVGAPVFLVFIKKQLWQLTILHYVFFCVP